VKNRQYSVKIFEAEIEDDGQFIDFLEKHYLLFKDHLIHVTGEMSEGVERYLKEKPFFYLHDVSFPEGRSKKALESEFKMQEDLPSKEAYAKLEEECKNLSVDYAILKQEMQQELNGLNKKLKTKFTVIDTIIRSGRELKIDGDLLLLNRVNSGATIHTTGNLIITQVVEGALRCDGQFMMITVSPKANIVFHGVLVDNELLENKLNRIELKENKIHITPVIKKEINWEQS